MTTVELQRQILQAELLDAARGFERVATPLEIRWDPLTGHTSRLARAGRALLPPTDFDLAAFAEAQRPDCPFCTERIETLTPKLPPELHPDGRLRVGDSVLFPNLYPYAQYSAVSVFSPALHFLPLATMTPKLVADNLAAQAAFATAVVAHDPAARWATVNANHMLPSGSSVFHPHLQGNVNPVPTTMQRLLAEVPADVYEDYVRTEKRLGRRWLGSTGRVSWLAAFAPIGPAELRAFLPGVASPAELDADGIAELGHGIALALNLYGELGFDSYNLAVYGAPSGTGYPLNLRMLCRSRVQPLYRSDAQYLERMHWEAAVDIFPEELADHAGNRFQR